MKTEGLSATQLLQQHRGKSPKIKQDPNESGQNSEKKEVCSTETIKPKEEKREIGEYQVEAIRKMLDQAVEWRDLRYYRNEHDGIMYIDVVDRETGEVIRTIPEPDIQRELSKGFYAAGTHINIDG